MGRQPTRSKTGNPQHDRALRDEHAVMQDGLMTAPAWGTKVVAARRMTDDVFLIHLAMRHPAMYAHRAELARLVMLVAEDDLSLRQIKLRTRTLSKARTDARAAHDEQHSSVQHAHYHAEA